MARGLGDHRYPEDTGANIIPTGARVESALAEIIPEQQSTLAPKLGEGSCGNITGTAKITLAEIIPEG